MKTKHKRNNYKYRTQKKYSKTGGKKWKTAIKAAQVTFKKTG